MAEADIQGTVTDSDGNPVEGAEVYLWREDLVANGGVLAETTTDTSGNYIFETHPDGAQSQNTWHVAAKFDGSSRQLQFESAWGVSATVPSPGPVFSEPNTSPGSVSLSDLDGNGAESDPYVITNDQELQAVNQDPTANYELGANIDLSDSNQWNSGTGFTPIGPDFDNTFRGTFDGKGKAIKGLFIDRGSSGHIGLFGRVKGTVKNVRLTNADVTGDDIVGGLIGQNERGTVTNASASGSVTGGRNQVGGLVGQNFEGTVKNAFASGSVTGDQNVAGLVGFNERGTVTNASASGSVTGGDFNTGGLIGFNDDGTVTNAFAVGSVTGDSSVGGLVGQTSGTVETSFAAASVTGNTGVGGLVGNNFGTVETSYWDTEASGQSSSAGSATPLTTSEMQGASAETNMSALDFVNVFKTVEGDYPELRF